jgi:hypothetical protein
LNQLQQSGSLRRKPVARNTQKREHNQHFGFHLKQFAKQNNRKNKQKNSSRDSSADNLYAFVGYFFLPERIYWGPAVFAPGTIPEVMDTITS